MEYQLPNRVFVNIPTRCDRAYEFLDAIKWLLETYPETRNQRIDIGFFKKDGMNFNANADYERTAWPGYFASTIRVSYGKKGIDRRALKFLFHEYQHLIQAVEDRPADCVEAEAWAIENVGIYLRSTQTESWISDNLHAYQSDDFRLKAAVPAPVPPKSSSMGLRPSMASPPSATVSP